MNLSKWIRQTHRWLSIRVVYSPLLPLFLLLFSGLYMFVLPYVARSRGEQGAQG
ncbi:MULTISPECIES: hypothetical protein [unclassified Mesorhizobium]|uniref:hypothetical protein n=1 Tax=unclassified Mesorhizobium TaxID=325217 RepID=UPI00333D8022